ncbi:tetratricopeptide repeat protein [uncultured Prevotella sp.]|uniref:tetratricopeptide repeat protein n=1 Tax=uncultured Prevotella sp. TaxID=159272 RepID=UPI0027E32EEA|nr:tetratricopeptide repeat protein [uncultured Prevotella sp.]
MTNKIDFGANSHVESSSNTEAFFIKFKKQILIAVVAVIVVIAGLLLYKAYVQAPREDKASTALAKGQQYFNQEQFDKALNGDGAGYAGFVKIASDYSGTDAANLADLYAGLCYANLGKWAEAVTYLEQFSSKGDAMISPSAMAALGNAYANTGNVDKAISTLKKAADMADSKAEDGTNNSLAPTFLVQAAQLLESQKKNDEALKIYQDVKKKYVNAQVVQSSEIDKYIERVAEK